MRFFTSVHLLLLAYVIAALVFWGISLQKQSETIFQLEKFSLQTEVDSNTQPEYYSEKVKELESRRERRTKQYIGEGTTFLIVILIGAAVVYSSFRRSIRLSKQQNNFMLSVTHELKSPVAAIKLNLQTLERHQLDEQRKNQLIERCINEANRLNDLCNNLLIASQMEGRQYKAARERLDLAQLVHSITNDYIHRYPGRFLIGPIAEEAILVGDKLLLQMALNNLLENAVKYTPADKPVVVQLTRKNKLAFLQIIDRGIGIPDAEKKKIFNKFYRIGNEETRKTKGTGLGLYLTLKIVKQHKGRIIVKDNQPNGSVFEIDLPLV